MQVQNYPLNIDCWYKIFSFIPLDEQTRIATTCSLFNGLKIKHLENFINVNFPYLIKAEKYPDLIRAINTSPPFRKEGLCIYKNIFDFTKIDLHIHSVEVTVALFRAFALNRRPLNAEVLRYAIAKNDLVVLKEAVPLLIALEGKPIQHPLPYPVII